MKIMILNKRLRYVYWFRIEKEESLVEGRVTSSLFAPELEDVIHDQLIKSRKNSYKAYIN